MATRKEARSRRTRTGAGRTRSRPALTSRAAILALVLCAITLSLAYPLREYIAQRAEITQLRQERAELEESVTELSDRRSQLADPDYIERQARTRLNYEYPEEYTYVVLDSEDEQQDDGPEVSGSGETWFARLWDSVGAADSSSTPPGEIPEARPLPRGD